MRPQVKPNNLVIARFIIGSEFKVLFGDCRADLEGGTRGSLSWRGKSGESSFSAMGFRFSAFSLKFMIRPAKVPLNLNDCRSLTGLSESKLGETIKSGELKAKITGRGYKVKRNDLDEFAGSR